MVKKIVEEKPLNKKDKIARIKRASTLLNKKFGKEVVSFASGKSSRERIPFTCERLNYITGGGVPRGAFTVLWGAKASGKTSQCYDLIKNAQDMGLVCMHVDLERSFDPRWAEQIGVNLDELLIAKFDDAEKALDTIVNYTKDKLVDFIVLDSIQGLCPEGEWESKKGKEKSLADDTMGLLPRRLSKFFAKAVPGVDESNCAVVMIGQTRMNLGGYVVLEQLTGGNALMHWSSLTMHIRRAAKKHNPEEGGFAMNAKIDKSKIGADEGKETIIPFVFGKGFQNVAIEEVEEEEAEDGVEESIEDNS